MIDESVNVSRATSPYLTCGACCACFRVSFYWADALARGTPELLVEKVTPLLGCMAGTNREAPRCAALNGTVGTQVQCEIYDQRPSTCHDLKRGDEKCSRARARYG